MAQSRCSGLLVFQAAAQEKGSGSYTYGATCYGVTNSVGEDAVDLQQHHATRELSMEYKNAQVYSLHCLGSSIYSSGQTAPPFCLGVEFLRYSQAMIQQQQQQQHAASRAAAQHLGLPSTSTTASSSSSSTTADVAASYHAAHSTSLQQQRDLAEQDAFLQQEGFLQDAFEEQQQQQQRDAEGLLQRAQRRRQEINEQLEGQDPLWFAKAFAHRASLNWESMKRLAGDIAAQAKADLGFEPDETE